MNLLAPASKRHFSVLKIVKLKLYTQGFGLLATTTKTISRHLGFFPRHFC